MRHRAEWRAARPRLRPCATCCAGADFFALTPSQKMALEHVEMSGTAAVVAAWPAVPLRQVAISCIGSNLQN